MAWELVAVWGHEGCPIAAHAMKCPPKIVSQTLGSVNLPQVFIMPVLSPYFCAWHETWLQKEISPMKRFEPSCYVSTLIEYHWPTSFGCFWIPIPKKLHDQPHMPSICIPPPPQSPNTNPSPIPQLLPMEWCGDPKTFVHMRFEWHLNGPHSGHAALPNDLHQLGHSALWANANLYDHLGILRLVMGVLGCAQSSLPTSALPCTEGFPWSMQVMMTIHNV